MRTRVKFCGFCNVEDLIQAQMLGVDAVGFVLYEQSKRFVSVEQLQKLARYLTTFVTPVLLFVNPNKDLVIDALRILPNATLQFHGNEPVAFCSSFSRPWIKAVSIQNSEELLLKEKQYCDAQALLVDAPSSQWGGSGKTFDWNLIQQGNKSRIILAGGLSADNVAQAIRVVKPCAVDVSSGIEIDPGKKDFEKMKRFLQQVRLADQK